jgi:hypothetical protein
MNRTSFIFLLLLLLLGLTDQAAAQVTLTGQVESRLVDSAGVHVEGGRVYLKAGSSLATEDVILFRVDTEAGKTTIIAREITNFPPVTVPPEAISDTSYEITQRGKWWITAKVHDREKDIWGEAELFLELGGTTPKPPGPNPPGPNPPGPNPPPPSPVPNAYGVGQAAYQSAPRDIATAARYSVIYKQAADFLFGVPSLKFVYSSNDPQNNDPARSISAWIAQEQSKIPCTDKATCDAWKACREKVKQAFFASQSSRQYTRQDWFNALNEVSKAFEAVK